MNLTYDEWGASLVDRCNTDGCLNKMGDSGYCNECYVEPAGNDHMVTHSPSPATQLSAKAAWQVSFALARADKAAALVGFGTTTHEWAHVAFKRLLSTVSDEHSLDLLERFLDLAVEAAAFAPGRQSRNGSADTSSGWPLQ